MKRKRDCFSNILPETTKKPKLSFKTTSELQNTIPESLHSKINFKTKYMTEKKVLHQIILPMINEFANYLNVSPQYIFKHNSFNKFYIQFENLDVAKEFLSWFNSISPNTKTYTQYIKSANSCYNNLLNEQKSIEQKLIKKDHTAFQRYNHENLNILHLNEIRDQIYQNRFNLIFNKKLICFEFIHYLNIDKSVIDFIFSEYDYYLLNYNLLYILLPLNINLDFNIIFNHFQNIKKPFLNYSILHPNEELFLDFFLKKYYRENK